MDGHREVWGCGGLAPDCGCFDLDGDLASALIDLAAFQRAFIGSYAPAFREHP